MVKVCPGARLGRNVLARMHEEPDNGGMAMGTRKQRQEEFWVATTDLPRSAGHPFYERLNELLEEAGFDGFVEDAAGGFTRRRWGVRVCRRGCTSGCC